MARRALQSAAVAQGAPAEKKLWQQIKWLEEHRKITLDQKNWSEAARWVGNHGAHDTEFDAARGTVVVTDVTEADAGETIKLVEHLFETIYVARKIAHDQLAKRDKLPRQ